MTIKTGKLIAIAGLEGASKSTSIITIEKTLQRHGLETLLTREPGGTPMAEEIRNIHKKERFDNEIISSDTEMMLMFASRQQSYENVVIPALLAGKTVILDRSHHCSFAYQVFKDKVSAKSTRLEALFNHLRDHIESQAQIFETLFLDIPPDIGLARARGRGELDRIEKQHLSFFERARKGYQLLALQDSFTTINANDTIEAVQASVEKWAAGLARRIKQ